ncbi:MAG: ATP-binding protein [Bacteroides sp.]|nr:ATP-binding protein [Bacteroides sp.]MCM1390969.1 ATP-binding protein [Bacteroides sp.]
MTNYDDINDLQDCDVALLCGVSGSGKTTFARQLAGIGFEHLSLDGIMWDEFGDFSPEEFMTYSRKAHERLKERLRDAIANGRKAVVDATLCKRSTRDEYRKLLDDAGAKYRLVYCHADAATLRERLHRRNAAPGREAAIVTDEMLDRFLMGFQPPMDDEPHIYLYR